MARSWVIAVRLHSRQRARMWARQVGTGGMRRLERNIAQTIVPATNCRI